LARYLIAHGFWREAAAESETLAAQVPDDEEAHFLLGRAQEGFGDTRRAIEAYTRAVSIEGSPPRYRLRLARILWADEKYYQAAQQWRAVLAQDADNIEAHLALGRAHEKFGEPLEAFRQYQHVLAIAPDHPGALNALANMGRR
jgi:cytochrome c-type biogenesis protein CcmH/NrfG